MKSFFHQIHVKLGDLWWYTILLFIVNRFGDVINMFVGLWLVPKYVPAEELGAVMPLTQFISLIGLPLGVVAIPFMKYLGVYANRGEYGKVKSLLRDAFVGAGILAVVTILVAWLILPFLFERCRIATGSLGLLVVVCSVLGAVATIFSNAVQGLKLFKSTVWIGVFVAPLRLIVMLVTMPFRAISGYFMGQMSTSVVPIVGSLFVLRKRLGKAVKAVPYWKEDGRAMMRYALPVALSMAVGIISSSVDMVVIRHRLSTFESAGYYMITRFTDIANYFGTTFVVFLFPLVASAAAKSRESLKTAAHSAFGSLAGGIGVGLILLVAGDWILSLNAMWAEYRGVSGMMFPICLFNACSVAVGCLSTYEIAQGRFRFLWYGCPLLAVKCLFLYSVTGITFFVGILPQGFIDRILGWQPCRLSFVVYTLLITQAVMLLCYCIDIFALRKKV